MATAMGSAGRDQAFRLLEIAIRTGRCDEAAALAYQLAADRVACVIIDKSIDMIDVTVVVEKNGEFIKTLNVEVLASDTLWDLKDKVHREHGYPANCQRWIIDNILRKNDDGSLTSCGITSAKKTDVFLTIIEPRKPVVDAAIPNAPSENKPTIRFNDHISNEPKKKLQKEIGKDRPVKKVPVVGWICEVCTFLNQPTRPGCEMCSAATPESYELPIVFNITAAEKERIRKAEESERKTKEAEERQKELERQEAKKHFDGYLAIDKMNLVKNRELIECPVCMTEVEPGEGVTLRECFHSFCLDCVQGTIINCEFAVIGCPADGCDYTMLDREIKELVPADVYQQHLQRSMNIAEGGIANTYHCLTPDCRSWCIYEDNVNTFNCPACNAANCLTCRAIHPNKSCKQYQDDILTLSRTSEEAKKTKETIDDMIEKKEAMFCPGCQVVIMRMSGCGWISCTYCKTEICWMTKQSRWGPKGTGDISGGCKCRVNGLKCHPDCYSCH